MSQPLLVKVYGNLFPADRDLELNLGKSLLDAIASDAGQPPLTLEGNLLLLSFEGVYFPIDEFCACLEKLLKPGMDGKIDYLDLENWRMRRYVIKNGQISEHAVSLNHVMDYSGF